MAATTISNLTLLLPYTLPTRVSLPTRLLRTSRAPPRRLRTAAVSRTLATPASPETPEAAEELQLETESALEWGGVCARLADFAATAAGRAACAEGRVPVGRSREESERLLEQTAAAVVLLSSSEPLDFGGVGDVSAVVAAAARGRLLAVREICGVGRSLRAARGVFEQLKGLADEMPDGRYSPLLDILQDCDFLTELVHMIEFCLDSNLSMVLDRASDKLGTIRKERRANVDVLESLLRDMSTKIFQSGGVDSPLVTKRRSRMCVGVKASHKHLVPGGIVLSSSGSGATYFMEPRDAVQLNNMEVKLAGDERAEELAVLGLLTSRIANSRMKIRHLMGKILELDLACARGSYALQINGVRPAFSDRENSSQLDPSSEWSVSIEGIQHPLLLEQFLGVVEESAAEVGNGQLSDEVRVSAMPVPLDMHVKNDTRIVVISGPNTGGKTATMKTLGLASLMSKAGMFFPAKGRPTLPWFDQVLADIGDHQSLENSLSTFSGNISRLRKIAQVVSKDSLVLIDEIGSGTDPSEGVSLSTSILKYLASRLNLAIVTTHYADLSRLKSVDDRFENAAMEFCLETLKPTYRILWGSTGNSNALSIAKSIGFDQKILDRAQEWVEKLLPDKQKERQGLLYDSLRDERNLLESQANEAASVLSDVESLYNEIRSEADDLDNRVAALRARESQKVQQELKFVKTQMDLIIKNFEVQLQNSKLEQYNSAMRKAEAATASLAAAHQLTEFTFSDDENKNSYIPQIGDKVYVEGLGGGSTATVVEILSEDGSCIVQYGKIKARTKNNKMKLAQRDTKETAASSVQRKWLKKTHRNPLYKAMEKMKEEMMLLGFISLLLAATSRIISGICIDSKYYNSKFSPCSEKEVEESMSAEHALARKRNHIVDAILHHSLRRNLKAQYLHFQTCPQGYESFVSHEGLEQLHRFIFVMAVTHVTYSCLTMLLAILKVHTWRKWEDEAFRDNHESFSQIAYASATRRQPPALTKSYSFRFWSQNNAVMWLFCFLAQFGQSVVRADYLILRKGFIMNHNLAPTYDFHNYMIRSMEEEFEKIVGVSGVLWGFVVAFMLFNIDRYLYFWIAILPVTLVLLVGAKLQHIIATLTSEGARLTSYGPRIKPRDDLFWFKKPKFLLWLIHFVLFQNAFELASFFWFWWQFGYESCFIRNHLLVYCRLVLGFAGQFLCSYSTLPVYALVTQMGSKYKAALIPYRIRETMHGWGKAARKRRKKRRGDDSTIRTETSTVCSLDYEDEDDDDNGHSEDATPPRLPPYLKIELRPMHGGSSIPRPGTPSHHLPTGMLPGSSSTPCGSSSQHALLQRQASASASAPSSPPRSSHGRGVTRSASMPGIASLVTSTGTSTPARRSDTHA